MENSMTSLSFGLLFFVFLSFQVLAHDEKHEANNLNTDGIHLAHIAANDNHPQVANGNNLGGGPIVPNDQKPPPPLWTPGLAYNPSKLNDIIDIGGIHLARAAANDNHPSIATDNNPEPENHVHGYVIKVGSTKPSEIDQRKSWTVMTKTTPGIRIGDKNKL